ncbi:MAG: CdaR family protein [Erysipelotrichaceae bacterium]
MLNNKNKNETKDKLELANRIAKQTKKVSKTYETMENGLFKFVRFISTLIDRILFNPKYTIIVSLGLSILLFVSYNYSTENPVINTGNLNSEKTITDVQVYASYNSETFELVGLPATADVSIVGTASNVVAAANKTGTVVANLDGYTEGTHTIKLTVDGYGSSVEARSLTSEVTVTLKKKVTGQFSIGYDFVNTEEMDSIYVLGTPVFETSKVNVRASQDTLDSIAFVKVLIDVSGQTESFEQQAKLVAYDKNGYPVSADISPSTVKVSVEVTTPSKSVPIILETTGQVPDGMAIDSIEMDHSTVTVYAAESILSSVNSISVELDASVLNKDTELFLPIILPNDVSNASISKVNLTIKLAEMESLILEDINLSYRNNTGNFKDIVVEDGQTTVSVEVFGTLTNIESIDASDLIVYFDMSETTSGSTIEYPLVVEYSGSNSFVSFVAIPSTVTVTVPESGLE